MSTITVGSGLGGFTAIAPQPTYGASVVTPNRTIYGLKSNKATHDPHIVQGGPYLENGRIVDIGAAHVQTWQDAKGTLVMDAMSSGLALLLASAFGTSDQLIKNGTASIYELGGPNGITPEPPERQNANAWTAKITYYKGQVVWEPSKSDWFEFKETTPKSNTSFTEAEWTKLTVWSAKVWNVGQQVYGAPASGKTAAYTCIQKTGSGGEEPWNYPAFWQVAGAQSGCSFDQQLGVPTNQGELQPYTYHSCVISKAEFVFERTGLVSCTFDWDSQYVDIGTTALITPVVSNSAAPFSMGNTASVFQIGAPGSMVTIPGARKLTFTLQRKLAVDRIYLGEEHKQVPSTNGLLDIMVAAEMDYTNQAKTVMETFLKNEPQELVCTAVGPKIAGAVNHQLSFSMSNGFIETGGEAPLDGPDIVKNTVNFKSTINTSNGAPVGAKLITEDSTF